MRTRLVLIGVLVLALAAPALAATKNGITPTSPAAGGTVEEGKGMTFKGRARGEGQVYISVCQSKRRNGDGKICDNPHLQRAKKTRSGRFTAKVKYRNYDDFWLNTPGTYYWQAYRIYCRTQRDCIQEGPVVRFKVG